MNEKLIKEIQVSFVKSNTRLFLRSWSFASLFVFLYTLSFVENILSHVTASLFAGILVACNILFINAAFDVINFFGLKMKLEKEEYLKKVTVMRNKGRLNHCLKFFTTFDNVQVYELNGKRLKNPIRATLSHRLQENEKTGSLVKLPIGYFYIPERNENQSDEIKKAA